MLKFFKYLFIVLVFFIISFLTFNSIAKAKLNKQININKQNNEFKVNIVLLESPSKKTIKNKNYFFFYGTIEYRFFKKNDTKKDFYLLYEAQKYKIYVDSIATVIPLWQNNNLEIDKDFKSNIYVVFENKNINWNKVNIVLE